MIASKGCSRGNPVKPLAMPINELRARIVTLFIGLAPYFVKLEESVVMYMQLICFRNF